MNIEDIITLDDNKEYLILDIIELNKERFLYCVEIDEEEMPKQEYKYLKEIIENGEVYTEEVKDKELLEALTALVLADNLE